MDAILRIEGIDGLNVTADIETRDSAARRGGSRSIAGIGRVLLWSGASLWIGRQSGLVAPHAHHAIQISLALSARLRFRTDPDGDWSDYTGVLIRPHHRHQFDGAGAAVAQLFVEPETALGRTILQQHAPLEMNRLADDEAEAMAAPLRAAFALNASDERLIATSRQALQQLAGSRPASSAVDARIARAIELLRARMSGPVSLAQAAAVAHLSPSRFRHLFAEQTGMTFRAYLLWARVEAAVGAGMGGKSWTEAAQDCGFADSAHLTRTCRRMFGLAPSMLVPDDGSR